MPPLTPKNRPVTPGIDDAEEPAVAVTTTDEQSAARELVRDWAAGAGAVEAIHAVEQGDAEPALVHLADLA